MGLVLAAAVTVGIVQNSQPVGVKYLAWSVQVSLAALLIASMVATVVLTVLVGAVWRRSRRRRLTGRAELEHLRTLTGADPGPVPTEAAPGDRPG